MKTLLIAILTLGFSSVAMADGFVCTTLNGHYTVRVYNHTDPSRGTRNAAILILADNTASAGHKTIATFRAENTLYDREGATYISNTDFRESDSRSADEDVLGTKLGLIYTIKLNVAFSYGSPAKPGEYLDGQIIVVRRDGQRGKAKALCSRYLKN